MKLVHKILLGGVVVAGCTGIIAAISIDFTKTTLIYGEGSSSVLPLLTQLSNHYQPSDVIANAGGSSVGINSALTLKKHLGMSSRAVNYDHSRKLVENKASNYEKWKQNAMKSFTMAWDGIAVIYKLNNANKDLVLNKNNLLTLYKAFAGFEVVSFKDLDKDLPDVKMTPYSRTGGANASGTTEAFIKNNPFIKLKKVDHKTYEALHSGVYGKLTKNTEEANSQAWISIRTDNINGAIGFLSTGYVLKNIKEINDSGFKVAYLVDPKTNQPALPFQIQNNQPTINVGTTYKWYRPFNLVFSINHNKDDSVQDFVWWLMFSEQAEKIIQDAGFIPLSWDQKISMFKKDPILKDKKTLMNNLKHAKNLFFVSDLDLLEQREIKIFGAVES